MARLPQPGGDSGNWGQILNEFLSQSLSATGTLNNNSVTAGSIAGKTITSAHIAEGSLTGSLLFDGTITESKMSTSVVNKLNSTGTAPEWSTIANKPAVIASGVDQTAARQSIGAGTSSITIGTTAVTAAAGNDSRLTDQRIPTDGSVTPVKLSTAIQTSLAKADTAIQKTLRPISSSYRGLKGVASNIGSTISPGETKSDLFYTWNNSSNHFRYVGCQPVPFSDPTLGINFNVGLDGSGVANTIEIEFWSNARTIALNYYNLNNADVWAIVDDMRISETGYKHADSGDGFCTWTLTQPSDVYRKWRIGLPALTFRGISINSGATMVPTAKGFQMAVIGDSYVAGGIVTQNAVSPGVSGSISAGALFGELSQETGIDVWRLAVSGSGYITDAGYGSAGAYGSTARMNALAQLPELDTVVVWSSANDKPHSTAALVAAAQSLWAAIRTARPTTPIIVVGPECTGWSDPTLDAQNNALRVAASNHPAVTGYVDLRNNNFMNGTGFDGSPQGDGNTDVFISADGSHLTHAGARYWGQNIARLLGNAVIPSDAVNGSF